MFFVIDLKVIRLMHNKLCEISQQINRIYSIQLLCCFSESFITITCYLYFCIRGYIYTNFFKETDHDVTAAALWGAFYSIRLILLCFMANITMDEVR